MIKGCRDDDKKAFLIDHLKSQANFPSAHGLVTDLVLEQVHYYYLFSGKILGPFLAYEMQGRPPSVRQMQSKHNWCEFIAITTKMNFWIINKQAATYF